MPARKDPIVIRLVPGIPPKYHVTKSKTLLRDRPEFIKAHDLAPQHAVDIGDRQLYFFCPLPGKLPQQIRKRLVVAHQPFV